MRRRNGRRRNGSRSRRKQENAAAAAPAIRQMSAESYATQNNLIGSITRELLVDPVRIRREPHALYERESIEDWLRTSQTSPHTRDPASVNDLVPAEDIQEEIRGFVARYRDSEIVRDWLQNQPAWYTRVARRIRDTTAPAIATMSRGCAHCCSKQGAKDAAGFALGAGVGSCVGCACGNLLSAGNPAVAQQAAAFCGTLGAAGGVAVGPEPFVKKAVEFCAAFAADQTNNPWDTLHGGKKKTRKNKKKKRRKTRRKKKKTRRKRKKNRKKSRKKKK